MGEGVQLRDQVLWREGQRGDMVLIKTHERWDGSCTEEGAEAGKLQD
jgi:hypothetical protein